MIEDEEILEEAKMSERRDFQSSSHKRGERFHELPMKSGFQSAGNRTSQDQSMLNNEPQSSACENLTSSDDETENKDRNFGAMASSESL